MTKSVSRRTFLQAGALTVASSTILRAPAFGDASHATGKPSPIHLGVATYTFRDFTREQMIPFLKQISVGSINAKDVKDHLPADEQGEAKALAD